MSAPADVAAAAFAGAMDSLLSVSVEVWPWGAALSMTDPEAPEPPAAAQMRRRSSQAEPGGDQ